MQSSVTRSFPPMSLPRPLSTQALLGPSLSNLSEDYKSVCTDKDYTYLRNSKTDYAIGADGISYTIVCHLHQARLQVLPNLFSNLLYHGCFPNSWKTA